MIDELSNYDGEKELPPVSELWRMIRVWRNEHLRASDWTQATDTKISTEDRAAWAEYRQALRDITDSFKTPMNVEWPARPGYQPTVKGITAKR